jgi:hypothetical protein
MARSPVYKDRLFELSIDPCSNSLDTTFKSQSLQFEYLNCKYIRIKSKISGLAEVKSASLFLSPLIANPLIFPDRICRYSANFFLVRY